MNESINAIEEKKVEVNIGGHGYVVQPLTLRKLGRLAKLIPDVIKGAGIQGSESDGMSMMKILQAAGPSLPEIMKELIGASIDDLTLKEAAELANAIVEVNEISEVLALFEKAKAKIAGPSK